MEPSKMSLKPHFTAKQRRQSIQYSNDNH